MKKTIICLFFATILFSCKKEGINEKSDFEINKELDLKLSPELITGYSMDELKSLAEQKYQVLYRLKSKGVTFEQLYPKKPVALKSGGDPCLTLFNDMRSTCNYVYIANAFVSTVVGAAISTVMPPVGVGVGAAGIVKDTYNYGVCVHLAEVARDACYKKK